jgi:hypothetical protein
MVESHARARTGASLRTHQDRTVANYLRLRELAPELPFIATLQGQSVATGVACFCRALFISGDNIRLIAEEGVCFEVACTDLHARLHSCPGAARRAPGNELCTVVALAQGMDHLLQDPERA